MTTLLRVIAAIAVVLVAVWGAAALGLRLPGPEWLARGTAVVFFAAVLFVLFRVRRLTRKAALLAVLFLLLCGWWATLRPANNRAWAPDVARLATGEVHGDTLVLHNVRNFDYRSDTDFTERWEDRTYDLAQITGIDLFLSHWGSPHIAHTVMSWDFADGQHLAISIETRKERGEEYSALRGFFRQYELYYVVADERDVIRVRSNYRNEEVYLYRLNPAPATARALLLDYVETLNDLAAQPRFYNALIDNCTTGIRVHVQRIGGARAWDWRLLANGHGDEMLYERGTINTSGPFAELKAASRIDARAKAADQAPDFSQRIREELPPRPR